jgi:hypothetical protein
MPPQNWRAWGAGESFGDDVSRLCYARAEKLFSRAPDPHARHGVRESLKAAWQTGDTRDLSNCAFCSANLRRQTLRAHADGAADVPATMPVCPEAGAADAVFCVNGRTPEYIATRERPLSIAGSTPLAERALNELAAFYTRQRRSPGGRDVSRISIPIPARSIFA